MVLIAYLPDAKDLPGAHSSTGVKRSAGAYRVQVCAHRSGSRVSNRRRVTNARLVVVSAHGRSAPLIGVIIAQLVAGSAAVWAAGSCYVDNYPSYNYLAPVMGLISPEDGKRHVKVKANNFGGDSKAALQTACEKWNALSDVTGVVFDPGDDWGHILVVETSDTNLNQGLTSYSPADGFMYASPAFNAEASNNQLGAARMWEHELGHYLGLDENNSDSADLMYQCGISPNTGTAATCLASRTQEPSQANATKVADCLTRIQNVEMSTPAYYDSGEEPDPNQEDYVCDVEWLRTDYYRCTGTSCVYWFSEFQELSRHCYPMEQGH